jgi:hypothetical protein
MEGLNMDDQKFDNIARRLGGLRSRREALKAAGVAVAAVFTGLGLDQSTLAQEFGTENHCVAYGVGCTNKKQCCGYNRRRKNEVVCDLSNAGPGDLCCGQTRASCFTDEDCCRNYFCSSAQQCALV